MPLPPTHLDFADQVSIEQTEITDLQSSVFPLVVVTPAEVRCVGTAFCVAGAGVLATARHVVDAADTLIAKAKAQPDGRAMLAALWYGAPPDGAPGTLSVLVPISDVCGHPDPRFDFALLTARVPALNNQRIRFPSLKLDFALPAPGDQVILLGYTRFRHDISGDTASIRQTLRASLGTVSDYYFPIRDRLSAPFPCFGSDARCDAGMSGGPALHVAADGSVAAVGLNISEYNDPDAEPSTQDSRADSDHPSFATALRSLLPMEVAMVGPDGDRMTRSLLDLGRDDWLVSDTDFDSWRLQMTEYGVTAAVHPGDASLVNYGDAWPGSES